MSAEPRILSTAGWSLYGSVVARAGDDLDLQLQLVQPMARTVRASTKDIEEVRAFVERGRERSE